MNHTIDDVGMDNIKNIIIKYLLIQHNKNP